MGYNMTCALWNIEMSEYSTLIWVFAQACRDICVCANYRRPDLLLPPKSGEWLLAFWISSQTAICTVVLHVISCSLMNQTETGRTWRLPPVSSPCTPWGVPSGQPRFTISTIHLGSLGSCYRNPSDYVILSLYSTHISLWCPMFVELHIICANF